MNTDEFIDYVSNLDPSDAPPEVIAKLFEHVGCVTKFAAAVSARANELAKAHQLPGYKLTAGSRKALSWQGDGAYPEGWYEKKLLTPTQVVKQNLATEKYLIDAELAVRLVSELVPVKQTAAAGEELF